MHLVPEATDEEAVACYDRCVSWSSTGSAREECVADCPAMRVFAGRCGPAQRRCLDVVRRDIHLDEEATMAALQATAKAVELAAEIHDAQEQRHKRKKRR